LENLTHRVIADVRALDAARKLELAIFAHRREDLLWKATHLDDHQRRADAALREAERTASSLDTHGTTSGEQTSLAEIRQGLTMLQELSKSPSSTEADTQSVYRLLEAVGRFEAENESQMEESMRVSDRLYASMSHWAVGLLVGTAGLLAAGAWVIGRRVLHPTVTLTRAARAFGDGDFTARAPVLHADELGVLAETFNNMADDIANREKDRLRFVAMVVHDLKNPVFAIEMAIRLLRASPADEQKRDAYLDAVTDETRRLRTIVRDLSDDIQVVSGSFVVRKVAVDLCALVRQLVQAQTAAVTDHHIVLNLHGACTVLGDAGRLERVVTNLVSNALKYSPSGTSITVRVERKEPFAVLSVCDQGAGISKEDFKVIFQPFGRGRSAGTLAEGSGLGLYVVKQIVEAHDGRIEVESELGLGATFRVKLPLA